MSIYFWEGFVCFVDGTVVLSSGIDSAVRKEHAVYFSLSVTATLILFSHPELPFSIAFLSDCLLVGAFYVHACIL